MSIGKDLNSAFKFHSTTIQVPTDNQDGYGFSIYGTNPVMIESLVPDSPADNAGLIEGDIIMEVNGHAAATLTHAEVANIIQYAGLNSPLTISLSTPINSPDDDDELYKVWKIVHHKFLEEKLSHKQIKSTCSMDFEQFKNSLENVTEFVSTVPLKKKIRQKVLVMKEISEQRVKNNDSDRLVSMIVEPGSPPSSPSAMVKGESMVPKVWIWQKDDVGKWLERKGLSRFRNLFTQNNVTGVDLLLPTIDIDWLKSKGGADAENEESCTILLETIHRLKLNTVGVNVQTKDSPKLNLFEIPEIYVSTRNLPKYVYDWTSDDVGLWLKQLHTLIYTKYLANFSKNGITGNILLILEIEHLRKIGVIDATHRNVLYKEILKLKIRERGLELNELNKDNQLITQV